MQPSHMSLLETESFGSLFERTHLTIFRFIYGLHGGPIEEVEDITSETFIRAWKGRRSFKGSDHDALCWLFTIARNLVIDNYRKKKSHNEDQRSLLDESTLDELFSSDQTTPEEQITNREQFVHLWKLLQRLPDDRREMIALRYMLGWQVKKIAQFLQMEENTVSVYIHRGIDQVRRDWIENEQTNG